MENTNVLGWFGLWCLTPLSTIFQLYRECQCAKLRIWIENKNLSN